MIEDSYISERLSDYDSKIFLLYHRRNGQKASNLVKKGKMPSYEEALPALRDAARSLRKAQAVGLYMDGLFEEAHLRNRIKNKQGR